MNLSIFIVLLNYPDQKAMLPYMDAHLAWADRYAASGVFLLTGPMTSLGGGAVVARAGSREELVKIMQEDPIYQANLVSHEIHEFVPRRGFLRQSAENPLHLTEEQHKLAFSD